MRVRARRRPRLTRASSSLNGGSPDRSLRIGSVLTRKPISGASSGRPRFALTVPTTRSCLPGVAVQQRQQPGHQRDEQRRRPARRLSSRSSASSPGSVIRTASPPAKSSTSGRGRSAGNCTVSNPSSTSRQYPATSRQRTSPCRSRVPLPQRVVGELHRQVGQPGRLAGQPLPGTAPRDRAAAPRLTSHRTPHDERPPAAHARRRPAGSG